MSIRSSGASRETGRQTLRFYRRGEVVNRILDGFPTSLRRRIRSHVTVVEGPPGRQGTSLVSNILGLLEAPGIRGYILSDGNYTDMDRLAAMTAVFIGTARKHASDSFARYIDDLLPVISRVIRPVLSTVRLSPKCDFRVAVSSPRERGMRLSLLGPLAMFFLITVARGRLAWDTLVGRDAAPSHRRPFAWVPAAEGLLPTLRFLLLGQTGRSFKRKALLYSPFARYLIDLGVVCRVRAVRMADPVRPKPGGHHRHADNIDRTGRDVGRWLLGTEYVAHCPEYVTQEGRRAVVVTNSITHAAPWEADEATVDRRTGRQSKTPPEEFELAEVRERSHAAIKTLLRKYVGPRRSRIKRLALWAQVARVDDPALLLDEPDGMEEALLSSLLDAVIARRVAGRTVGVAEANLAVSHLAAATGQDFTFFTSAQFGTYLSRLRGDFWKALQEVRDVVSL